ncbi:GIY-YIG nuclease family protein [Acholeplasma vituli]|uniref:GIY-YIG nuclease family protein n=1 Tax=Paracholeplasma vituli TaxID=69473 RepID=A0ABT2PUH7_9MOLU|nr:GIY-YIG nuclease family protein [Paracholeplasma vituli]MCU0104601.1 GIY-YIG nuclease family protein [Paracholeplasma vituli]
MKDLTGWNYIVYTLIKNNFKNEPFTLDELYRFESYFQKVYPANLHVKDKIRQILQNLRDKGLIEFQSRGQYQLMQKIKESAKETFPHEVVYLLSNESIPGWVKIGRTKSIDERLLKLYNTSVPLPFRVVQLISTTSKVNSTILEKSIHNIIDTINPDLRKNTDASKREFFKLTPEQGKYIFQLVSQIMAIPQNL